MSLLLRAQASHLLLPAMTSRQGQFRKSCPAQDSHAQRHTWLQELLQRATYTLGGTAPGGVMSGPKLPLETQKRQVPAQIRSSYAPESTSVVLAEAPSGRGRRG